jgi:hypothetical protein
MLKTTESESTEPPLTHHRAMIRQLLPGVILPGIIYFLVARHTSVLIGLAAASSVPALDALFRLLTGRRPTLVGLVFIGFAGISVALAITLRSPMFILAKGAVLSGVMGVAFGISALIHRPLTRTIAIALSTDHTAGRRTLLESWRTPRALAIFCTLSAGWGVVLLLSAIQQAVMVLTMSPGTIMATEPVIQATVTILGTMVSIMYVRRSQRDHPELSFLPRRAA